MRTIIQSFVAVFCVTFGAHASISVPELSPEEKAAANYVQGMNNPSKSARVAAIEKFLESKPVTPVSWRLFVQAMNSDPEPEVRRAGFGALAQMPAHDTNVAKMLVGAFSELKANDLKQRNYYAKLMKPVEFKYDTAGALADTLSKLRWPEEPKGYGGHRVTQEMKDKVKEEQTEIKQLLETFNDIAKSSVSSPDKEMSTKIKKWWAENDTKLQRADAEIMSKYAQADADAAKAAKAKADEEKKKKADEPKK